MGFPFDIDVPAELEKSGQTKQEIGFETALRLLTTHIKSFHLSVSASSRSSVGERGGGTTNAGPG